MKSVDKRGIGDKMTSKCKYTGREGYVLSEDCHCFCCGIHSGEKFQPEDDWPSRLKKNLEGRRMLPAKQKKGCTKGK